MSHTTSGRASNTTTKADPPGGIDGVVLLSPFPWDGVWQTTHYVASELARRLRVLYVEPRAGWHPWEAGFSVGRLRRLGAPRLRRVNHSLHIFTPASVPLGRWPRVRAFNELAFGRGVGSATLRLGFTKPLVWVSYYLGCLAHVRQLKPHHYVYHCLDYFEHGDPTEEAELSRSASQVFAVSAPLLVRQQRWNPRAELLPNGVAVEWFERPAAPPSDLGKLEGSGRIAGFVGQLSRHVDLVLLEKLARELPDVAVLVIGPVAGGNLAPRGAQAEALKGLRRMSNVRLLGFRPPQELPRYLQSMQVCLMPFQGDGFVAHADPLKFYQYLAAGKAIVTTPVPLAERYPELCYVARGPGEFVEKVREALAEPQGYLRQRRLDVAKAHGWRRVIHRGFESVLASIRRTT